jgi:hypothetical protein
MGAWNYLFDNDLLQRLDLERLDERARHAERAMRRAHGAQRDRIAELEQEVGQLALACRALIGMLKEQGQFDAAIFNAALDKLDADDGVIDGRVTPERDRPAPPAPPLTAPVPRRRR